MRVLHVRDGEREGWTEGPGARDAHSYLRIYVGAAAPAAPLPPSCGHYDRLRVAIVRGKVKRRTAAAASARPASRSAPPSAILPRPSCPPTPARGECRSQARSLPSCHPPPTSPPPAPRQPPAESPAAECIAATASTRRRRPCIRACTRVRPSVRASDGSLQELLLPGGCGNHQDAVAAAKAVKTLR
jgi:hypothetical protein